MPTIGLLTILAALAAQAAASDAAPWIERADRYEQLHAQTRNPSLLWLIAEARARAGQPAAAIAALEQVAERRLGFVVTAESPLSGLRGNAEFDRIAARLEADYRPTGRAQQAATVEMAGLVPEGIAAEPGSRRLFLGDMAGRRVVVLEPGGPARPFATVEGLRPLGMTVDSRRRLLWVAATTAFGGAETSRSAVLAFDLAGGGLRRTFTSAELRSVNDVALAPNGDLYVTDSLGGALFRLRPDEGALERVTPAGQMSYPNGVAVGAGGGAVYVAQGIAIRRLDVATGELTGVSQPPDLALLSIDGLYWHDDSLVAVQNGGSPGRILRLHLSADGTAITGFEALEARNADFDIPTTGAIRDGRLYVIANSQLTRLRDDGEISDPGSLRPIRILEIGL